MEKQKERKKEVLCAQRGSHDTQQHSKGHLLRGVGVSAEEMACSLKRLPQKLEGLFRPSEPTQKERVTQLELKCHGNRDGQVPRAGWPAILAEILNSQLSGRTLPGRIKWRT